VSVAAEAASSLRQVLF